MIRRSLIIVFTMLIAFSFISSITVKAEEVKEIKFKSAEVSSTQTDELPEGEDDLNAKNIIDGNESSRWSSEWEDNQSVVLELGDLDKLVKLTISWETAHAANYIVEVSKDKKKWKKVYKNEECMGGTEEISIKKGKGIECKYVRLTLIEKATEWGFSIYEIKAMGF